MAIISREASKPRPKYIEGFLISGHTSVLYLVCVVGERKTTTAACCFQRLSAGVHTPDQYKFSLLRSAGEVIKDEVAAGRPRNDEASEGCEWHSCFVVFSFICGTRSLLPSVRHCEAVVVQEQQVYIRPKQSGATSVDVENNIHYRFGSCACSGYRSW